MKVFTPDNWEPQDKNTSEEDRIGCLLTIIACSIFFIVFAILKSCN